VKVFPAATGGPGHVAALGGPLPQIPLVPTGGVGPSNAGAYIEAGAAAVGVGSAIVTDDAVANEEYEVIAENARRTVDAVAAARTDSPSVDQAIRDRNSEIRSVSRWVARETAPTASSSIDRSPSVVQSSRRRLVPSAAEADREDVSLGNRPPLPCGARF